MFERLKSKINAWRARSSPEKSSRILFRNIDLNTYIEASYSYSEDIKPFWRQACLSNPDQADQYLAYKRLATNEHLMDLYANRLANWNKKLNYPVHVDILAESKVTAMDLLRIHAAIQDVVITNMVTPGSLVLPAAVKTRLLTWMRPYATLPTEIPLLNASLWTQLSYEFSIRAQRNRPWQHKMFSGAVVISFYAAVVTAVHILLSHSAIKDLSIFTNQLITYLLPIASALGVGGLLLAQPAINRAIGEPAISALEGQLADTWPKVFARKTEADCLLIEMMTASSTCEYLKETSVNFEGWQPKEVFAFLLAVDRVSTNKVKAIVIQGMKPPKTAKPETMANSEKPTEAFVVLPTPSEFNGPNSDLS